MSDLKRSFVVGLLAILFVVGAYAVWKYLDAVEDQASKVGAPFDNAPLAPASTLGKGTQFECALLTPVEADSVILCQVMGDVYSFYDKTLAIPVATRMVGRLVNGQIVWSTWATPQGWLVSIPPSAFDTKLVRGKVVVSILALKDLKIQ